MGSYWHMDGPVLKDFGCGVHLAVFYARLGKGGIFRLHQNTIISFKKKSERGRSLKGPLILLGSFQGVQNWSQIVEIQSRS